MTLEAADQTPARADQLLVDTHEERLAPPPAARRQPSKSHGSAFMANRSEMQRAGS